MRYIRNTILLLLLAAVCYRCGNDAEIDIPAQRATFQKYLEGVTKDWDGVSVDKELEQRHNIYRITPWPGNSSQRVAAGDRVTIEYYGFVFSSGAELGMGGLFATNNRAAAIEAGLVEDVRVLPPEDLTIRQGAGEILRGIDLGLERAGLRDTILLYLTSDLTYGDKEVGFIAAGTPTVFMVAIKGINE